MSFFSPKPIIFHSVFDSTLDRGVVEVVDDWPAVAVINLDLLRCLQGNPIAVEYDGKMYFSVTNGRAIYKMEEPDTGKLNIRTMTRIMGEIDLPEEDDEEAEE